MFIEVCKLKAMMQLVRMRDEKTVEHGTEQNNKESTYQYQKCRQVFGKIIEYTAFWLCFDIPNAVKSTVDLTEHARGT